MSVYLYDQALTAQITAITSNTGTNENIHIIPAEKAFSKSFVTEDDIPLPAISLYRSGYNLTTQGKSMPMYRQGRYANNVVTTNGVTTESLFTTKALPISINYQLDIWTKTRQENDEFMREIIWYFTLNPQLSITLQYGNITQEIGFHVFIGDSVIDNSDIMEFENRGQYYRTTVSMLVDEAQFFLVSNEIYQKLKLTLNAYAGEGDIIESSIIFDNSESG